MNSKTALQCNRILTPEGLVAGYILINESKIEAIVQSAPSPDYALRLYPDHIIMPGIIDTHVHINEPGRTHWEGFESATKSAAAGGITTLIEMPLNADPVTTTARAFQTKVDATKNKLWVNCGFWGGLVPNNLNDLEPLLQSGVFGLKAFLTFSGIEDFQAADEAVLREGMKILKKYNLPLLAHCELDSPHDQQHLLDQHPNSYSAYLASRPSFWEVEAIKLMIKLCKETGAQVHIVHLSTAEALPVLQAARSEGLPITVETCPHYLVFEAENIPDGDTRYKCAPPIRTHKNNQELWSALIDGQIDFVVTDHSPASPEIKEFDSGNLKKAWGGIAGLQFLLPSLWTGMIQRKIPVNHLIQWLCEGPAKLAGLSSSKGKLAPGYDADIVIWNPDDFIDTSVERIYHRHKITPYTDKTWKGKVVETWLAGCLIYENGMFLGPPKGRVLYLKSDMERL